MLHFAVDTGGTFTDLVVDGNGVPPRFYKRSTTPADPIEGLLAVFAAAAADHGDDLTTFIATRRQSHLRHHASDERRRDRQHRQNGTPVHRRPSRRAPLSRGRRSDDPLRLHAGVPGPIHPPVAHLRDPRTDPRRRLRPHRAPRQRGPRGGRTTAQARGGGDRGLLSLVDPEPDPRAPGRRTPCAGGTGDPGHPLPRAEPEPARISTRVVCGDRRVAQAIDEQLLSATRGDHGRARLPRSAADHDLRGCRPRRARGRRAADPLDRLRAGRRPHRRSPLRTARERIRHRTGTDAGGTTYDVGLVRRGRIPWTRETLVGDPTYGYITGFPAVDVRSIGAGGGSIAWVDEGGLLHVGPASAGADPGPACYGRGGTRATVTDACLVLGYIDPDYFLGGEMSVSIDLARDALERDVSRPLALDLREAASAVLELATELMVTAIEGITCPGHRPGGRRDDRRGRRRGSLQRRHRPPAGIKQVVLPEAAAALSATGALISDLQTTFAHTEVISTAAFDHARAGAIIAGLRARVAHFIEETGAAAEGEVLLAVEARYPHQVWEIEVPLRHGTLAAPEHLADLREDFHQAHEELFAVRDSGSRSSSSPGERPGDAAFGPTNWKASRQNHPPATWKRADTPIFPGSDSSRSMSEHTTR